ncbi:MAG: cupin domain-containing protein [Solirubrobacteraceae bacterium]
MRATTRAQAPIAIEGDGVEVRVQQLGGGISAGFVSLPAGADLRPATKGLPDDLCPCPHWGYMIKGRVRMHTAGGHHDFVAGEAFYWAPGHAPEALEDSEYVDFSPTDEFSRVIDHITSPATAST